jgi:hypothetical protein
MQINNSSFDETSTRDKARPLTLEQVLRLRDGLDIARNNIPEYPLQIILPKFNQKKATVVCMN